MQKSCRIIEPFSLLNYQFGSLLSYVRVGTTNCRFIDTQNRGKNYVPTLYCRIGELSDYRVSDYRRSTVAYSMAIDATRLDL